MSDTLPDSTRARAGDLDAVRWIDVPSHADGRGVLTVVEAGVDVPFEIKRAYLVHDVASPRGGHAHRDTYQIVMAAHGSLRLTLSDGARRREFRLDHPARGVYLVPMLFIEVDDFSPGAVMLSLASTHYDSARSIRSWDAYLAAIRA